MRKSIVVSVVTGVFVALLSGTGSASILGGTCSVEPELKNMPSVGPMINDLSFTGINVATGYGACDDFQKIGIDYNVVGGEQRIRISSTAAGTGDASLYRKYRAQFGQGYTATATARMVSTTQENPGDFRVRLKLSSHDAFGNQEYECGTFANSGKVNGERTGVSPFVDLLVPTPVSVPMQVECVIQGGLGSDHQLHFAWRARREVTSSTAGTAVGVAALSTLTMSREF